jgi:hypothetical protein
MTSKGSNIPPVRPKTQRVAEEMRDREAEKARELAETERIKAEAEATAVVDLVDYLRRTDKEKITFNLSADICEAIRDHARPLRMSHSEIVERGVRMFFRSELIKVPGPMDE